MEKLIKEQIKAVFNYNQKEAEIKQKLKEEKEAIAEQIQSQDLEQIIKSLDYYKAKDYVTNISTILDYDTFDKVKEYLFKNKIKHFPFLKEAIYYPVLNQIDFLSREQIVSLDRYLAQTRISIISKESIIDRIKINGEIVERLVIYLLDKGIIEERYSIFCLNCDSRLLTFSKKSYEEQIEKLKQGDTLENSCWHCVKSFWYGHHEDFKEDCSVDKYGIVNKDKQEVIRDLLKSEKYEEIEKLIKKNI